MEKLFKYISSKVDSCEVYKKSEQITSISIKHNEVKAIDEKNMMGISLRMNLDGRSGSAVSSSTDDLTIVDRAIISSKYQGEKVLDFKNMESEEVKCFDDILNDMSAADLIDEGMRIIKKLDKSIPVVINIEKTVSDIHIINTTGFNDSYKTSNYSIGISSRSDEGFVQVGLSKNTANFIKITDDEIEKLIEKHNILNKHLKVKSGKLPVVFSGKSMGALMTRLLAGVNGELIVKGVSPIAKNKNEKIASEILSVYDDATYENGLGSYKFDDEGIRAQKTCLINKGILENFLVSVGVEKKLELAPTGNARKKTMFSKDIEDQPAVDSSNFIVTGPETPDEDIIKSIDYGIYVDTVIGTHTGNIPGGEYSLNIGVGYMIEDGKLTGKVVDAMVSGNIYEDLFKVEAIGTKKEVMSVVFYTMGYSPMVKFNNINVIGTK